MAMMRINPNGKNLVCRNCLERKPVQKQATMNIAETKVKKQLNASELNASVRAFSHAGRTRSQVTESAFKEYFCRACKYSFKRAKHLSVSTCPYCGASGSLMVKGSTAKIIADASKMKEDFRW